MPTQALMPTSQPTQCCMGAENPWEHANTSADAYMPTTQLLGSGIPQYPTILCSAEWLEVEQKIYENMPTPRVLMPTFHNQRSAAWEQRIHGNMPTRALMPTSHGAVVSRHTKANLTDAIPCRLG
jgi:hypothetical protein